MSGHRNKFSDLAKRAKRKGIGRNNATTSFSNSKSQPRKNYTNLKSKAEMRNELIELLKNV